MGRVGEAQIGGLRGEGEVEEEKGEAEHRSRGWRGDGEMEEEEGETDLRRSRFALFKRTLVEASSATGAVPASAPLPSPLHALGFKGKVTSAPPSLAHRRTRPATPVPNEVLFDRPINPYPLPHGVAAARKNARSILPSSARSPPPLEQPPWPRVLPLLPLERNTTPGHQQSKRFLSRRRLRLVLSSLVFASSMGVDRRGEGIRLGFGSVSSPSPSGKDQGIFFLLASMDRAFCF